MMTKEGSDKIVNFMTPRVGVLVFWHGHMPYSKMHYFLRVYQNFMTQEAGFLC